MRPAQRKILQIPGLILTGFVLTFTLQLTHKHFFDYSLDDEFVQLDRPLDSRFYQAISMGSDDLLSYLLMLKLQLHDNQKGEHVSYNRLDYQVLTEWLYALYQLNPRSEYPGFIAAKVYSQVNDPDKIRLIIKLIDQLFELDQVKHWRRMTEASLLAKHQLQDLPLALEIAKKVAALPDSTVIIPYWARDMKLILLDELNQHESAQLLISSMLQSGTINDPDEIKFLESRLLKIQQKLSENEQSAR